MIKRYNLMALSIGCCFASGNPENQPPISDLQALLSSVAATNSSPTHASAVVLGHSPQVTDHTSSLLLDNRANWIPEFSERLDKLIRYGNTSHQPSLQSDVQGDLEAIRRDHIEAIRRYEAMCSSSNQSAVPPVPVDGQQSPGGWRVWTTPEVRQQSMGNIPPSPMMDHSHSNTTQIPHYSPVFSAPHTQNYPSQHFQHHRAYPYYSSYPNSTVRNCYTHPSYLAAPPAQHQQGELSNIHSSVAVVSTTTPAKSQPSGPVLAFEGATTVVTSTTTPNHQQRPEEQEISISSSTTPQPVAQTPLELMRPQPEIRNSGRAAAATAAASGGDAVISMRLPQRRVLPTTLLSLGIYELQGVKNQLFAAHTAEMENAPVYQQWLTLSAIDLTAIRNRSLLEAIEEKLAKVIQNPLWLQLLTRNPLLLRLAAEESDPVKQQLFIAGNAEGPEELFQCLSVINLDDITSDVLKFEIKKMIARLT